MLRIQDLECPQIVVIDVAPQTQGMDAGKNAVEHRKGRIPLVDRHQLVFGSGRQTNLLQNHQDLHDRRRDGQSPQIDRLDEGEHSKLIETSQAYYILKLDKKDRLRTLFKTQLCRNVHVVFEKVK